MPNARDIIKQRGSVANICKITGTMEMIATARFKKSHERAFGGKPYTRMLSEFISALTATGPTDHPLLRENPDAKRTVLLVLTSNRGLCGGYNGHILRLAKQRIAQLSRQSRKIELRISGNKGIRHFRFLGAAAHAEYTNFDDKIAYADVENLSDELIDLYARGEINAVHVVYTCFVSSVKIYPEVLTLLPLVPLPAELPLTSRLSGTDDYFFSPASAELFSDMIPAAVCARLFQCFADSLAGEQMARMRAMHSATDSAEQMIRELSGKYNRVRQGRITSELLDIIGGVEALKE